ncbi:hypothetical protein [Georgenia sp. AZ-5]|uniref:hypothetical protein n=1 Tax=Georgenia sp. AZ-5 TaxID=3367526 RepID=UPI003754E88A
MILTRRLTPELAGYVAVIVLGLFVPLATVLGYLAIAVYVILPLRPLRRRAPIPR